MRFYVGVFHVSQAHRFERCMVSANRLRGRRSDFAVGEWMLDSGAFTQVTTHGRYLDGPEVYAGQVRRWAGCGHLAAAVTQDFMCEGVALKKTGLTVADHQRLTVERYDALKELVGADAYLMPVLQGFWPDEYVDCLRLYGDRLESGQWVGVGSVCKRNAKVEEIERVLMAVRRERPDLRLHGFGVKETALASSVVRKCLASADSMAWSYAARRVATPLLMRARAELGRKVKPAEARRHWKAKGVVMPDPNDHSLGERMAAGIDSQLVERREFQWRLC